MSLALQLTNLATRVASEVKSVRTLVNGNAADLASLTTTQKSNLVGAVNELKGLIDSVAAGTGAIADGSTGLATTWSSSKITTAITTAIDGLIDGAPGALDTLRELAEALGDDPAAISSITTALGRRVSYEEQTVAAGDKTQARANIGAAAVDHPHDAATAASPGFMSAADKQKLDTVAANANAYVHPTGDGNTHVPVTGTGNNGRVLMAGATAGSTSWVQLLISHVSGLQDALDAKVAATAIGNTETDFVTTFEAGLV